MRAGPLKLVLVVALASALGGCPKSKTGDHDAAVAASASGTALASASAGRTAAGVADAGAGEAGAASTPAGGAASYAGTYTLAPATLHIPEAKDYAHVKQAKDDPSKLVGAGTLSFSVAADGRVTGEVDTGPASPATIDGSLVEGEIRGVVRRKTPTDEGLTGTIIATIAAAGGGGEGKLTLAEANASLLREGPVSVKRK